jgi:hypothetical protein
MKRKTRLSATAQHVALAAGVLVGAALADAPARAGADIEQIFATSLMEPPRAAARVRGSVYVPAYSSVSLSQGKARADFSVTLSIHNASEDQPLVLKRIAYFDTSGQIVESYLVRPIALRPFATIQVYIPVTDIRGGTGANFVVDWEAIDQIAEPIMETLMVGSLGSGHYSFISQGRPIRKSDSGSGSRKPE